MAKDKKVAIRWLKQPKAGNYPAALSFLSLIFPERVASKHVARLKGAAVSEFKSKDIFRASGLPLLGLDNHFVAKDRRKILAGESLSPILLVRDDVTHRVIVADGYHRMCAVYGVDEDALIHCRIV
jgi:hypothetical protein